MAPLHRPARLAIEGGIQGLRTLPTAATPLTAGPISRSETGPAASARGTRRDVSLDKVERISI